jgi:hypothetical protein
MSRRKLWIRRCLALCHLALGLVLLLGVVSYTVVGIRGLPQLLMDVPRTDLLGSFLLVTTVILLPESALGAWMLILARWLWSGRRRLRIALLATHGFMLLLGSLAIAWGFHAIDAAERSTAQGGGLLSPAAFLPFLFGVPLLAFALCSIVVALWATPRPQHESQ